MTPAHSAAEAPSGAAQLAASLTTSAPSYKRRAWLAVAALLGFVAAYLGLAGWFLYTAWRLSLGPGGGHSDPFLSFVVALCAAFLAVFMIKAVFFIQKGQAEGLTELLPDQQPDLFRFLHELADKAGAPRPHKVYVSARVNAAVFYDLSLLNLLLPSRKNLEIGLSLVNSLTLGEMRAVLAHEFGHFAQRSMAVGRWVYVAHQIAANMIARRDKLDAFLVGLSRFDIRFAWVGWILQAIVWSLRSLVAAAFQGVILMQRALSREMEMQADLVAVSLTGSDALVHALLKLQAADDSWERTLQFAAAEKGKGKPPRDVFAMQLHVMQRVGEILQDPLYGRVPALPEDAPEPHRVFKAELAQPPRMWLSHPLNHEREANAKKVYLSAPIDARPAWSLFANPEQLREQVTAQLIGQTDAAPVDVAQSLAAIDEVFDRPSLHGRYRGVYLGRSIARHAEHVSALSGREAVSISDIERLYPATLVHDIELQRQLERELAQLQALHDGVLQAGSNEIRYRGKVIQRRYLPSQIELVRHELDAVRQTLRDHDRLCRSAHLAAAQVAGQGWEAYVKGLLAALHYADHTEANLLDLQGVVGHTFRVVTATGKVSDAKLNRLIQVCNELQGVLAKVFAQRQDVLLDVKLRSAMNIEQWADALGELALPQADRGNINEWLKVVDGWVGKAAGACAELRRSALDQLLSTEAMLACHVLQQGPADVAPAPSSLPAQYDLLLLGQERKPQDKLDWWARFQTADGKVAAASRVLVAGSVVGAVLMLGGTAGTHHVTIYNGLSLPVVVSINGHEARLGPLSTQKMEVDPTVDVHVETRASSGQLIEAFDEQRKQNQVYNVGGASPLLIWTAVYGPASQQADRLLGAPRWFETYADAVFTDPPASVSTRHGEAATRDVLRGLAELSVKQQIDALSTHDADLLRVVEMHARWDSLDSPDLLQWLYLAQTQKRSVDILRDRLAAAPGNVLLLRAQQDLAADAQARDQVCMAHLAQASAQPQNPDWAYLALRCQPEDAAKVAAFIEGHRRWPAHAWFAYAAGYGHAEQAQWPQALQAMKQSRLALPSMREAIAEDEARVLRLTHGKATDLQSVANGSRSVLFYQRLESDQAMSDDKLESRSKSYVALSRGNFVQGLSLVGQDPQASARWLRLAAASDGAPQDMIEQALALSVDAGMDPVSYWYSVALRMRLHRDTQAYQQLIQRPSTSASSGEQVINEKLWHWMSALQQGGVQAVSEQDLLGLSPLWRGVAYCAGASLLGERAPGMWRDAGKRLLFATERPYFN